MTADKDQFLKYFITEPVYVIKENQATTREENNQVREPEEAIGPPDDLSSLTLKIKGNNSKHVLVLVDEPQEEFINGREEIFLTKILSAVKIDINDIAIVNFAKNPQLTRENSLFFNAGKYIIFGVNREKLFKDDIPPYQIIELGGKQLLNCSSLSDIAKDKSQKSLLWDALQEMFL